MFKKNSLIMLFFCLFSCQLTNEVDEIEKEEITDNDLELKKPFTTLEQHLDAFYTVYYLLSSEYYDYDILSVSFISDILAGDIYKGGLDANDWQQGFEFQKHSILANNRSVYNLWERDYSAIRVANAFLTHFDDNLFLEDLQEEKEYYKAEIKALRGHFYFELGRFFENVPILPEDGNSENNTISQASTKDLYSYIANNLYSASLNMKLTSSSDGRLSKYSALAELVKVYTFYSSLYNYESITLEDGFVLNRSSIIEIVEDIINNSGASLETNYKDLFLSESNNSNFNKEVLFEIVHDQRFGIGWSSYTIGNIRSQVSGPRGYNNSDFNQGWGFGVPTHKLWNSFHATDLRKEATIITGKDLIDNGSNQQPAYSFSYTGLFSHKYTTHKKYEANVFQEVNIRQNYHYIRLADIYLLGAELYLLEDNRAKALEYLNAIRNRAGLDNKTSITMNDIMSERYHELALEGHRYFDLLRWGLLRTINVPSYTLYTSPHVDQKYMDIYSNQNLTGDIGNPDDFTVTIDEATRGFFPIPQKALDENKNLIQNGGY